MIRLRHNRPYIALSRNSLQAFTLKLAGGGQKKFTKVFKIFRKIISIKFFRRFIRNIHQIDNLKICRNKST